MWRWDIFADLVQNFVKWNFLSVRNL
jgi:hypothetical protein